MVRNRKLGFKKIGEEHKENKMVEPESYRDGHALGLFLSPNQGRLELILKQKREER